MPDNRTSTLPVDLLRHLADSELKVVNWDTRADVLVLEITKAIGPEHGIVTFCDVSHVNLCPSLSSISGIESGGLNELPAGYLDRYRPRDKSLDADEIVFLIHGSWGDEFFVIAKRVEYRRLG